jgi:hypothetical protein
MQPHEFIFDSHIVLETFGRWPSFHDGEVHRLVLDRTRRSPNGAYVPAIELVVRGWNVVPDDENSGLYKEENDSVVHFLFEEVTDVEFDGFNHQNVLDCLEFALLQTEENTTNLGVELVHCYGLSGGFKALHARVLSVTPYLKPGR